MANGVIEKRAVMAKEVDSLNRSAKINAEVQNGSCVSLSGYETGTGESEVWTAVTPATETLGELWMVATPEVVVTDSKYKGLDPDIRNFSNPANSIIDVFKPQVGDLIKLTADAVGGTKSTNTFVVATDGELKLQWGAAAISGLSLKLRDESYISLGTGAIGSHKITAYTFEVVAVA